MQKKQASDAIANQYVMRFYEDEFPAQNELGRSTEKSQDYGCYVALLEYNNKRGMMPINEYTTAMRKAIRRAMKVGTKEILRVIRVDKQKDFIDLSKNKVNAEEEIKGEEKFAKSSLLHSILINVSEKSKVPILDLYKMTIWPLYKNKDKIQDHPLNYLKDIVENNEAIDALPCPTPEAKKLLFDEIKRRFKRPIVKTMASFSITARTFQGINLIKHILQRGIDVAKHDNFDVKIMIIGAPKYICEVSSTTVESGKEVLRNVLAEIKHATLKEGGEYATVQQPYTIGDSNQHIREMIEKEQQKYKLIEEVDDEDMGDAADQI